jgi:hypothetical protein
MIETKQFSDQQHQEPSGSGGQRARDRFSKALFLRQLFDRIKSKPKISKTPQRRASYNDIIRDKGKKLRRQSCNRIFSLSSTPEESPIFDIGSTCTSITSQATSAQREIESSSRPQEDNRELQKKGSNRFSCDEREYIRESQKGPNRFAFF